MDALVFVASSQAISVNIPKPNPQLFMYALSLLSFLVLGYWIPSHPS